MVVTMMNDGMRVSCWAIQLVGYAQRPDGKWARQKRVVYMRGAQASGPVRADEQSRRGKRPADEGEQHLPSDGFSRRKKPRRSAPPTATTGTDASTKKTKRPLKTVPRLLNDADRAWWIEVRTKYMKMNGQVNWERAIRDQKKVLKEARQEEKKIREKLRLARERRKKDKQNAMAEEMTTTMQPIGEQEESLVPWSAMGDFQTEMDPNWWMPSLEMMEPMEAPMMDVDAFDVGDMGSLEQWNATTTGLLLPSASQ